MLDFQSFSLFGGVKCLAANASTAIVATDDEATDGNTDSSNNTFGDETNKATLTKDETAKTLTITGHGDLTKIDASYKFSTTSLPNNTVFTATSEGENATYTAIKGGTNYSSETTYYTRSESNTETTTSATTYDYSVISFDSLVAKAYITNESAFIKALWTNANIDTVKFVNDGTDGSALYIDNDIVKAILYPQTSNEYSSWHDVNKTITTLDLGAATVKGLSGATFENNRNASGQSALKEITLPLTEKSANEEVVVPSQILLVQTNNYPNATSNVSKVNIPEDYTKLASNAFGGVKNMTSLVAVTLPTTLTEIGDSAFMTCSKLSSITFNEGLKTIGKRAFWSTGLTSIAFPTTLDKIDDAAFANLKIQELNFNSGLRYIGNAAFALSSDMTLTTIKIPASVRFIGPAAFNFRQYQDVYFLGEDAPLMPMDNSVMSDDVKNVTAFSSNTLMGNNGFNPASYTEGGIADDTSKGYANRENYKNNQVYFCILHYPAGLSEEKANDYEDQTRVYKTETTNFNSNDSYTAGEEADDFQWTIYGSMSQPQKTVNYGYQDTYLGEQYVWPSQSQWGRAYVVASNGYNWNGKDLYYSTLTDDDYKVLKEAGFIEGEISQLTDEQKKVLQKNAHLGTRMFVLANPDSKGTDDYPLNIKEGGKWWTIVVPFNMTKKQVDEVFGDGTNPTHVCRFNKVDRTETNGSKHVKLYFTDDVHARKATKTNGVYGASSETTPSDDDIVIYAHEAYMIYPTKQINYDNNERFTVKGYTTEVGSPLPTIVKANAAKTEENADHTEYRFIGNYIGDSSKSKIDQQSDDSEVATTANDIMYVPQYSYMYAKKTNDKSYKFWFWYGDTKNGVVWNPNTCVVQATAKDGGLNEYKDIFGGSKTQAGNSAKQISIFGEDDETTGVEQITIIAGNGEQSEVVYNLNGQPVSSGSLSGLAKGIYIQGGKKFVVK